MNFNIEDYINEIDLSPELEEKARQCSTASELLELAAEENIELSDDALEAVAGGGCGSEKTAVAVCNYCGNEAVDKKTVPGRGEKDVRWCRKCNRKLISDRDYHIEYR
ncbi:MAG: hypothetical protein IJ555_08275 [Ruminococcus sp.]|nr:hypothetical protein [Ruminococcus sp.]MBR1750591.1 hypothetical protein [Ruminococcus sp.]